MSMTMTETDKYVKEVSRANPGCIIFLLDQSFSMTDGLAGSPRPKIEVLATAINRFLGDLIIQCEKGEEKPRNYFDVAVIGYTSDKVTGETAIIKSLLPPSPRGGDVASIVDLYDNPLDKQTVQEEKSGQLVETVFPIWYNPPPPEQMAGTPMCKAMEYCHQIASNWCFEHPASFPPMVIHMTDGESTDGDPETAAANLRALETNDGNLLLFNCHLSSSPALGVLFPSSETELPDDYAKMLFRLSSTIPERLRVMAEVKSIKMPPDCAGWRSMPTPCRCCNSSRSAPSWQGTCVRRVGAGREGCLHAAAGMCLRCECTLGAEGGERGIAVGRRIRL